MATRQLGDKGLSIFTFAAYHALSSGETVTEVVLNDGAGHAADPEGIREVEAMGLATIAHNRAVLTDSGTKLLAEVLKHIRGTAKLAEQTTAVT